ncbi:hypothetical protein D3C74_400440 [compost metagenome]
MLNLCILFSRCKQRGIPHQQQLALHHERYSLRFLHYRLHRRLGEVEGNYGKITILFGDQVILQQGRKFIHPEFLTAVEHI